jgi:Tol biopolymer transport system component
MSLRILPVLRLSFMCAAALLLPELAGAQPATTRVSVGPGGVQGNQQSNGAAISADGRWVAFVSWATNLVAGDTNACADVFVRDRWMKSTTRVSVGSGGVQANSCSNTYYPPSISADGRFVAIGSSATNLVSGDTNGFEDVFVHDRQTGATTRVSVGPGGAQANYYSASPSISADGRWVAFESFSSNLVGGDTNGETDVFVHDRQTATTTRVSVASGGVQGNDSTFHPTMSADGRWVGFLSWASNLVAGDTNGSPDVFVHDRQTGTTTRVNVGPAGIQANALTNSSAAISADGPWVAFSSSANNLVPGDTNGKSDVFVHDRQTGATTRVSVGPGGAQANSDSLHPAISADGRWVAFRSDASNLLPGDPSIETNVFVHDRQTGTTSRVSEGAAGHPGNGPSYLSTMSADGRWVAFSSDATDLVAGDTNSARDVFLVDRRVHGDVDSDGRADPTIYRPSSGVWYVLESGSQYATGSALTWGVSTDVPVAGDYDGDGRMDMGVYRPSTGEWYVLLSGAQFTTWMSFGWGVSADVPVPADYDGDGRTDFAVYRPSTGVWYVLESRAQYTTWTQRSWGVATDVPVPGDYDGDGRTDLAVYRPSTGVWYVLQSAAQFTTSIALAWGLSTDLPVPGDYDGDGRTDLAVYLPSTGAWYVLESGAEYTTSRAWSWGVSTDVPVPADFDGDRRTDVAVYRPSTGIWFVLLSSTGFTGSLAHAWGTLGDVPVVVGAVRR